MHITVAIGGNAVTVPHRSVVPSAPVVAGDPAPADRAAASVTKEQAENFPVALRVLPRRVRADLRAVYDVVRLIDDTGDEARGDRSALLTALSAELAGLWQGRPAATPELARLAPAVDRLPEEPFQLLIEANLQDQRVTRYADRDELLGYCALSAAPIGRLVLAVFGVSAGPARIEQSDRICAALQLLEHWQDIAEDRRSGRIYLPRDAMTSHGVPESALDQPAAGPALRRLVLAETDRAAQLLESGAPLVGTLRGWPRLAVAGYLAGGRATVDALRRCGGDVLTATPRPRRRDLLRHLGSALATGGRR